MWVARRTRSPSRGCGSDSFPGSRADPWGISPPSARSSRSSWRIAERIRLPWIQPFGRPAREEDPPRLVAFPFAFVVAFFARSRVVVFSFPIVTDETRTERRRWGESERDEEA